jgi:hypothetical protein
MTAHHGIRQMDVFNDGLKLATILPCDFPTEQDRELVWLADRAIGVQKPVAKSIQCRTAREDQIVAIFNLSEKHRAMDYAVAVYQFLPSLPEEEKYNLASQLRRAVTSAPLNIARDVAQPAIQSLAGFLASLIVL